MSQLPDLEWRAQTYSALGDPLRLAIVDRLTLTDAAPGDLCRALDVSTNLLAHHLRVLEKAAVIRRVRSEGDRRRTYVRLRLDDPIVAGLGSDQHGSGEARATVGPALSRLTSASRVVFVCTHNSARSQLATAVWSGLSATPTASAGTHPAVRVHARAVAVGRRHGLRLSGIRPVHAVDVLRTNDLVVAVCDNAYEELGGEPIIGAAHGRSRLHWSVPDPVRIDTDDAFESAYLDIVTRVERLVRAVAPTPETTTRSEL